MKTSQKKAVIYLRVSTEEQLENFSLNTQEEICKKEAERRKYSIEKIFREEGKSAKNITGRPTLIQLMEYCRKNKKRIGALIIYRLDRLSRQTGDYLAIRKRLNDFGITVISTAEPTGDSPTEKLIETILAGFAQLDNDIRSERSRNGMNARFMSGLPNGTSPLGYLMVNGYVMKDVNCFDQLKQAWKIMATGTKSIREMSEILNSFKIKSGKTDKICFFKPNYVHRMFRSKFYMGVITSKKYQKEVQGQHIPMITPEQFLRVQIILDGRNPNKVELAVRNRNNRDFPLRRFIKCSKCTMAFSGSWSQGKHKKYAYYHCHRRCKKSNVPRKIMHDTFINLLRNTIFPKEYLAFSMTILANIYKNRFNSVKKKQLNASRQIDKLRTHRQALINKNLSGIYSDTDFKEQFDLIEQQLHNMFLLSKQTSLENYTKEATQRYIQNQLTDLPKTYEQCEIKQKRTLIGLLFPKGFIWHYPGLTKVE